MRVWVSVGAGVAESASKLRIIRSRWAFAQAEERTAEE